MTQPGAGQAPIPSYQPPPLPPPSGQRYAPGQGSAPGAPGGATYGTFPYAAPSYGYTPQDTPTQYHGQQPNPYQAPQPAPPGYYGAQAFAAAHRPQPRTPGLYALASFFIPGLGTMLNGRVGRGLALLFAVWLLPALLIIPLLNLLVLPVWCGLFIVNVVDGYQSTRRWNHQWGWVGPGY